MILVRKQSATIVFILISSLLTTLSPLFLRFYLNICPGRYFSGLPPARFGRISNVNGSPSSSHIPVVFLLVLSLTISLTNS
jgi:hypothetical protein